MNPSPLRDALCYILLTLSAFLLVALAGLIVVAFIFGTGYRSSSPSMSEFILVLVKYFIPPAFYLVTVILRCVPIIRGKTLVLITLLSFLFICLATYMCFQITPPLVMIPLIFLFLEITCLALIYPRFFTNSPKYDRLLGF